MTDQALAVPRFLPTPRAGIARVVVNLIGAIGAAYFVRSTWQYYEQTHRVVGGVLVVEQTWVVIAYLVRRPARSFTRRPLDWALAFGGTFGGVLLRPVGTHPPHGLGIGLAVQSVGLLLAIVSFLSLGRSFGFAAADRGVRQRGAYAVVRHPVYASYIVMQTGYVLQSTSWWNASVVLAVTCCNVGRVYAEERVLATNPEHEAYRSRVRRRLVPGIW